MGFFSWRFCDRKGRLKIGGKGVLLTPDGNIVETHYDGYGHFDFEDVYELVADWNRKYLSEHPEYVIPHKGVPVSERYWYKYYANLDLSHDKVEAAVNRATGNCFEYRYIGIDLACYDEDNANLPFPIKVASQIPVGKHYAHFPASLADEKQGCD